MIGLPLGSQIHSVLCSVLLRSPFTRLCRQREQLLEAGGSVSFERGPLKGLNMHRDCRPMGKSPLRVLAPKAWPQKEYSLSSLTAYPWKQHLAVAAVFIVANFWELPHPHPQSLCASSSSQPVSTSPYIEAPPPFYIMLLES